MSVFITSAVVYRVPFMAYNIVIVGHMVVRENKTKQNNVLGHIEFSSYSLFVCKAVKQVRLTEILY